MGRIPGVNDSLERSYFSTGVDGRGGPSRAARQVGQRALNRVCAAARDKGITLRIPGGGARQAEGQMSESARSSLLFLVVRLPNLIVCLIGLWLSFSRSVIHPRVSRIAMIGFACLLSGELLSMAVVLWIQFSISSGRGSTASNLLVLLNMFGSLLHLVALFTITYAVFADRSAAPAATVLAANREESTVG